MTPKPANMVAIVEESPYLTVVCCRQCEWREVARSREHGWYLVARHLKDAHGDFHGAEYAMNNVYRLRRYPR